MQAARRKSGPAPAGQVPRHGGLTQTIKPNALWSRLASGAGRTSSSLQRSPLSDSVKDAFTKAQTQPFEALLARLSQSDVQSDQADADVDKEIASLLAGRSDDLWVAQRIRQGKLGDTTGHYGPKVKSKDVPRPIKAFFFQGTSSERALVIAGVHGTEKQGIEVANLLIADLQKTAPFMTTIVVPSLFPDNAAAGTREAGKDKAPDLVHTNRNFPEPSEDLAAATAAGKGTAVDASKKGGKRTQPILPENVMLLELLEKFKPERIISIHGTWRGGAGGVFFDPRNLKSSEVQQAKAWADAGSPFESLSFSDDPAMRERGEKRLRTGLYLAGQAAHDKDEDLSRRAAESIDKATAGINNRDQRSFGNREDDPKDPADPNKYKVPKAERARRAAHPSVAGNVDASGSIGRFSWSGGTPGGVSLGEYASKRGMSIFTVEPPINADTADYAAKGFTLDKVNAADRRIELQSYADAVRTVLLGK